ncbi:MAG: hypothetical protein ACYS67_17430, partial [Planctomycetota bacterium]
VYTCIYQGRLFWMWGDTGRPSYPLGHFATAGAVSDLPGHGGLDPAIGINLKYYVDENGFSKKMCPLKERGMVWLDGLMTLRDKQGRQRMVAKLARMKSLGEAYERGLVVFNNATESFEPLVRSGVDFLPYPNSGHAFRVNTNAQEYYYFATQFPLAVRMRVRAEWNDVIDPNNYEVLTTLELKQPFAPRLVLRKLETPYRWISFAKLTGDDASRKTTIIKTLKKEKENVHLYDIKSGKKITPHGGTVYFNAYRQRWITIFVQHFGESSLLGEVWYAEADTPVGPWAYTKKIATHNKYSFYNPKQHPFFDNDDGRVIFFEGTYSHTFSGSAESATPRYDYNQIMYRLNLDDPRLALPVAVYQIRDKGDQKNYLLRDGVEKGRKWNLVESIPFYAIEPARVSEGFVGIYVHKIPGKNRQTPSLTVKSPLPNATPLFYALPTTDTDRENSKVADLYEYRHADTAQRLYSTRTKLDKKEWIRTEKPLCRVWKAPANTPLIDSQARPATGY